MKKIVIQSVRAVRLDGRLIQLKAGAVIDTAEYGASVLAAIDSVLVDHSAPLEATVLEYLALYPEADSLVSALAVFLFKS